MVSPRFDVAVVSIRLDRALVEHQRVSLPCAGDPLTQARFVWSVVHGVAMLIIGRQLRDCDAEGAALTRYAVERILAAVVVQL